MVKKLTRTGTVGLELTREEVIEARSTINGIIRKAQCREVNCYVLDMLSHVESELASVDDAITDILEE